MTGTLEDAVAACKISLSCFKEEPVIVNLGGGKEADVLFTETAGNGACPYFALCAARSSGAYNAGNLWGSCNGKAAVEESDQRAAKTGFKRKTGSRLCAGRCFFYLSNRASAS